MKFLSSKVAFYFYKSTIQPSMEYCCHVWASAPSCYLSMLDKLQKPVCGAVGPSFVASLEPLAHRWNLASLNLFYSYYCSRCSSELAELVTFSHYHRRSTHYSNRLDDSLSRFLDDIRMSMSPVSFLLQKEYEFFCLSNAFL